MTRSFVQEETTAMIQAYCDRIEALETALREIKNMKPAPVARGFVTGPQALLDACQRIAQRALSEAKR